MMDRNRPHLIETAELLRPLLGELVFVGGAVTGLLVTDSAAGEPRGTIDVDAIAGILSYADYVAFGDRLRRLGFSSRWYRAAMKAAVVHRVSTDLDIRVVTAPYLVATKLEAFRGRGQGDLFASRW